MSYKQDIVLRPRFKIEISESDTVLLDRFEESAKTQSDFIVSRVDKHVFIKIPKDRQQFWSPQLHLEITDINHNTSRVHGLFGPNPTVWTMFIFFHFIVAGLFIACGIWAYSNWSLDNSYAIQLGAMCLLVIVWLVLYFAGRIGRDTSKEDMHDLNDFMNKIIKQ